MNRYLVKIASLLEKGAGLPAAGKSLPKGKFASGLGSASKSNLVKKQMPGQNMVVPQGIFKSEQMAKHTKVLEERIGRIAPKLSKPPENVAMGGSKK